MCGSKLYSYKFYFKVSSLHSDYLPDLLNMPVDDLYEGIPPTYAGSNITKTILLETFKNVYIYCPFVTFAPVVNLILIFVITNVAPQYYDS